MAKPAPGQAQNPARRSEDDPAESLGSRIRTERQKRSLSVRELARRIGVSASLISQVETGRVRPSVSTLMAVVTELGLSLDNLFSTAHSTETTTPGTRAPAAPVAARAVSGSRPLDRDEGPSDGLEILALEGVDLLPPTGTAFWSRSANPQALVGAWTALGIERAGARAFLELESGVRWERLTPQSLPGMEFLHVRYEPGASSTASGKHTRHEGIEFGYVTSGTLNVTVGFDQIVLGPGDSLMFDAATPHRLENPGEEATEAVWLIIGRQSVAAPGPLAKS